MGEVWKDIVGYEGKYAVSSQGRVMSLKSYGGSGQRLLKTTKRPDGYLKVVLSRNGEGKNYLVHRLVAMAFLPNPNGLEMINHKDEVRSNNCVDNLEWCSRSYNQLYSLAIHPERRYVFGNNFRDKKTGELFSSWTKRVPKKHFERVLQKTEDGIVVAEYENATEAAIVTGLNSGGIIYACKTNKNPRRDKIRRKDWKARCGGFIWEYE